MSGDAASSTGSLTQSKRARSRSRALPRSCAETATTAISRPVRALRAAAWRSRILRSAAPTVPRPATPRRKGDDIEKFQIQKRQIGRKSWRLVPDFRPPINQTAVLTLLSARHEPGGVEPTVRLAIIGQPVDVPMPDERGIGGIDGRAAADEDHAPRKAREHVFGSLSRMDFDNVAIFEGKGRDRNIGLMAHDEHMAARQLEKTLHIGDEFAPAVAFPGQFAVETELATEADGNNGANVGDL